jgi:hypothetical protein
MDSIDRVMETKVRVGGLVSNPFPYPVQGPVSDKGMAIYFFFYGWSEGHRGKGLRAKE